MAVLTPPPNAVATSSGYTWMDADGCIIAIGSDHQLHTLEHAIENTELIGRLKGSVRRPFLIDMTRVKSMSKEAREYYAGPEPKKNITAVAILTTSNVGKAVANFFLLLTSPSVPTRMFTNFTEAKAWLLKYKDGPETLVDNEHLV